MATIVKIQSKINGQVFEFPTLDGALRGLHGIEQLGDRFEQVLLQVPSRRTFKEANGLLERNGWRLFREGMDTKTVITPESVTVMLEKSIEKENGIEANHNVIDEDAAVADKAEAQKIGEAVHQALLGGDEGKKIMESIELLHQNDHQLMSKFNGFLKAIDKEFQQVNEQLADANKVKEIVVKKAETGEKTNVGKQHYQFELLLAVIAARVNSLLVGPAGSGKTSAANNVAKALNLPFYSISVGMQTTKTEFFGYMDATGKYVKTLFRTAFEHGGVFLLDEMDAGNANVITAINQALANGYCAFPDGMVTKHPDFVVVSSANTYGTGANREYVGRNQLDAATLDRFAVIDWNYDEKLEAELCPNKLWLAFVHKCRRNANTHKIRTVVSPRASIMGAQLLAQGINKEAVKQMLLYKGVNETEKVKLIEGATF